MKVPVSVIRNKHYSSLIFLIADGKNYAQAIHNETGKLPQLLVRQLSFLEKKGYVRSERVKLLNKKIYVIEWSKIIEELIKYTLNEVDKSNSKFKDKSGSIDDIIFDRTISCEEIQSYFKSILSSPSKRILKNKYLLNIFPYIFQQVYRDFIKKGVDVTIDEIFDSVINELKEEGIYSCVWEWLKTDSSKKIPTKRVEITKKEILEHIGKKTFKGILKDRKIIAVLEGSIQEKNPEEKIRLHKKLNDLLKKDKDIEEIHYLGLLAKCIGSPLRSIIVGEMGNLTNKIIKDHIDKDWIFL